MKKEEIRTDKAALPIGPYSQGVKTGNIIWVAGEKGIDPVSNQVVAGGIEAETRQTLNNIKAILEAAGAGMDNIVRTVVYMTDLNDFGKMNEVYASFFGECPPGRTTVQVAALPAGVQVEIESTAVLPV